MYMKSSAPTQIINNPRNLEQHFYFYSDIGDTEDYVEFVHTLDHSTEGDVIHMHFATGGGNMEAAIVMVHAMFRTEARLIGYADGGVASAGTILLLACHDFVISPFSSFMFHDGSLSGAGMKFNENRKQANAICDLYSKLAYSIYKPFFTDAEIDRILEGVDYYLSAEEMIERLDVNAEPAEDVERDESDNVVDIDQSKLLIES